MTAGAPVSTETPTPAAGGPPPPPLGHRLDALFMALVRARNAVVAHARDCTRRDCDTCTALRRDENAADRAYYNAWHEAFD